MNSEFSFRRIGSTGCEILCDGVVTAWTTNEEWATVIVALLNNHPCVAVGAGIGMPDAACGCQGLTTAQKTNNKENK
jgi:hypothetical protein